MMLSRIPAGVNVFIDANIFIYHFTGNSADATNFLRRCEARDVAGFTSWPVFFEVLHRLMLLEAVTKGLVTAGNVARKLRDNPGMVRQLDEYFRQGRRIPEMGVTMLSIGVEDMETGQRFRRDFGLLVNDSLILALMERHGIGHLATADMDFRRVSGISMYPPGDLAGD